MGAAVFVAGFYWYLYLRGKEEGEASAGGVRAAGDHASPGVSSSRPAA